ncbi:MAG: succinate dehydrogenase assembly factor 4 [Steroidobacteraceae bacterium]
MQATPEFPAATSAASAPEPVAGAVAAAALPPPREIGGPAGPEPTRYGDWERKGRCIDF